MLINFTENKSYSPKNIMPTANFKKLTKKKILNRSHYIVTIVNDNLEHSRIIESAYTIEVLTEVGGCIDTFFIFTCIDL